MLSDDVNNDLLKYISMVDDQEYHYINEFQLESGQIFNNVRVAYKSFGKLNHDRSNVVLICHALTGSADAADWWGPLFGPGRVFDTSVLFVICFNMLASPYGSICPLDINKSTGRRYGIEFPRVTIRDNVRIQKHVLDELGIPFVQCVIGGSMGGMQVLEWSIIGKDYVKTVIPIGTPPKQSAWSISWNHIQRQTITRDPTFNHGRYSIEKPPNESLGLARMQALLTYRSHASFEARFGSRMDVDGENFAAHSYLMYQAQKFTKRFDALCYIKILDIMDTHDLFRGRYETEVRITQPALIIGVSSDLLFPVCEQEDILEICDRGELRLIESQDGHDGFLLEFKQLSDMVKAFLTKHLPVELTLQWSKPEKEFIHVEKKKSSLIGED